jgi:hypothetical protein
MIKESGLFKKHRTTQRHLSFVVLAAAAWCIAAAPRLGIGDKGAPQHDGAAGASTITVQQSGKWSIEISDTPTVKVTGQGAGESFLPGDSAVPFLKTINFNIDSGTSQNNVSIVIPEGKRLIVEHVSARAQGPIGQKYIAQIQTNSPRTESPAGIFWLVFYYQGTFAKIDVFTASQPMHVCAEPGKPPLLFVATRTGISGTAFVEATISGFLVKIR